MVCTHPFGSDQTPSPAPGSVTMRSRWNNAARGIAYLKCAQRAIIPLRGVRLSPAGRSHWECSMLLSGTPKEAGPARYALACFQSSGLTCGSSLRLAVSISNVHWPVVRRHRLGPAHASRDRSAPRGLRRGCQHAVRGRRGPVVRRTPRRTIAARQCARRGSAGRAAVRMQASAAPSPHRLLFAHSFATKKDVCDCRPRHSYSWTARTGIMIP